MKDVRKYQPYLIRQVHSFQNFVSAIKTEATLENYVKTKIDYPRTGETTNQNGHSARTA